MSPATGIALADTRKRMNDAGIEVSLFIAPDAAQIEAAARIGSQFVELHTGAFAENFNRKRERAGGIGAVDRRRAAGPRLGLQRQRRARRELPESGRAACSAAPGGTEHRPQHHQPRRDCGTGHRRAGNAAADGGDFLILGVGIDIIEVERILAACQKFGERFTGRFLLPAEVAYCLSHKAPGPFLAARFAGKEAISKAFGTGIGAHLGWQDIEIRRKESGQPCVVLHGKGLRLLAERGDGWCILASATPKNTPPPSPSWKVSSTIRPQ